MNVWGKIKAIFFYDKKGMAIFFKLYIVEKNQQKAIAGIPRLPFVVIWVILRCRSPPFNFDFTDNE